MENTETFVGKVRALGVSTKVRLEAFPDIPPISEAGVPGVEVAGWFMVVAPAKTPPAVVAKLHPELRNVLARAVTLSRAPGKQTVSFSELIFNLGPAAETPLTIGSEFPGVSSAVPYK